MTVSLSADQTPTRSLGQLERPVRSRWEVAWHRFLKRPGAVIGAIVILLFILMAIFAPLLAPFDPIEISRNRRDAPSSTHWFGTDELGRDVLVANRDERAPHPTAHQIQRGENRDHREEQQEVVKSN